LGDRLKVLQRQLASSGDFALDHEFWHCRLLSFMRARGALSKSVVVDPLPLLQSFRGDAQHRTLERTLRS
jgi:hypothetical protein